LHRIRNILFTGWTRGRQSTRKHVFIAYGGRRHTNYFGSWILTTAERIVSLRSFSKTDDELCVSWISGERNMNAWPKYDSDKWDENDEICLWVESGIVGVTCVGDEVSWSWCCRTTVIMVTGVSSTAAVTTKQFNSVRVVDRLLACRSQRSFALPLFSYRRSVLLSSCEHSTAWHS